MLSTHWRAVKLKQTEMEGDNPYVPEEIIRQILKRLPVKSLTRFQLVCEYWKNLIKSPSFIDEHLRHSGHQNPYLIFGGINADYPFHFYMPDRDLKFLQVQIPSVFRLCRASYIDSSNGLLCIRVDENAPDVILWNPAIREFRRVGVRWGGENFKMGFGFSSMVNDYKVVFIRSFTKSKLVQVHQVDVYSLITSSWKKVECGKLLDGVAIDSSGKTINGVIFWFGVQSNRKEEGKSFVHLLVSYDIAKEVFDLIPLPISDPIHDLFRCRLAVHENKLALLSHATIGDRESSLIDLWVMEEGTGALVGRQRWIKKDSIKHPFLLRPATIWKNEIVCQCWPAYPGAPEPTGEYRCFEANIVLANLSTDEYKREYRRFVVNKYGFGFDIFNYVESLVPVGNKINGSAKQYQKPLGNFS